MLRKLFLALPMAAALALMASPALAHEHDTFKIGDKTYVFTIGSFGEPLVVDSMSGVDLTVTQNGKGVAGLEKDLKVEISAGDKKKVLDLEPSDTEGAYSAPFIPTVPTTLSYRVFGTINNVPVDLTFTCQPEGSFDESAVSGTGIAVADKVVEQQKVGGFGCPEARDDFGFPESAVSGHDLSQQITQAQASTTASQAATQGSSATLALIVGSLGVLLGLIALGKKR